MNGITIPMAIMDFIPVCLFFAAALILQRDLYNKMVKGAFALLAAGSIMVLLSGLDGEKGHVQGRIVADAHGAPAFSGAYLSWPAG